MFSKGARGRDRAESALVWLVCLVPVLFLLGRGLTGGLSANPIEFVLRQLGLWALRFVCLTLALSPLAKLGGFSRALRYRRRIGLTAFAYVCLHLLTYVAIDQEFDWGTIAEDIAKRPYITIGMAAFALLTPLAVTSITSVRRKMKPRSWRRLHQAVYLVAAMGVVHYLLLVKADLRDPIFYGVLVAALLALRLVPARRPRRSLRSAG